MIQMAAPVRRRARLRDDAGPVMRRSFERWFALSGSRIREARQHAGLTLFELARRANISSITLSVVELGHKPAKLELLYRVAKVLCVEPQELLP